VGRVTAWNGGAIWSPFRGLTFRATYARSVRAPNISNLYASQSVTFLNGLVDPCNQAAAAGVSSSSNITTNPNRARNCAAAGIPTTIINPTTGATVPWSNLPASGVQGVNQGNIGLTPEIGNSFTVGTVLAPEAIPGLVFKVDYYNIRVKNVISGLSGQAIIDRCYDDPTGINNIFCAAVFRRQTNDPNTNFTFNGQTTRTIDTVQVPGFALAGNGISFINQPYNFALLKTRDRLRRILRPVDQGRPARQPAYASQLRNGPPVLQLHRGAGSFRSDRLDPWRPALAGTVERRRGSRPTRSEL